MYEVIIKYRRECIPFPMVETFFCKRFERKGNWIEFEKECSELIVVSLNSIIRISVKRCQPKKD